MSIDFYDDNLTYDGLAYDNFECEELKNNTFANSGLSNADFANEVLVNPGSMDTERPLPDQRVFFNKSHLMKWDAVHEIWGYIRGLLISMSNREEGNHFEMITETLRAVVNNTNIMFIDRRPVIGRIQENLTNMPPNWTKSSNCFAPTKQKPLSVDQCDVIDARHYNLLMDAAEFSHLGEFNLNLLIVLLEEKLEQNGLEVIRI